MKIVAYSKVPAATPFVHLGYLAASTAKTKPIQGLLLGGLVLLFVGLSMAGRRLVKRRQSAPVIETGAPRICRFAVITSAILVAGLAIIGSAYIYGQDYRVFNHPEAATHDRLWEFGLSVANRSKPGGYSDSIPKLPTQEGQYLLSSALGMSAKYLDHCTDGWDTPLMLRVTQHEGQLTYTVASAGPDRTWGTRDDITDPNQVGPGLDRLRGTQDDAKPAQPPDTR